MKSDYVVLFIIALFVRLVSAWFQQQPNYMDAAYYYMNGVNLAQGQGFVQDFVWNYLGNPQPPPLPSHLYWMPLTSILAALGMAVGGVGYRAAQVPFVVLSALLAPVSYYTAFVLSGQRRVGRLAGLLAVFSGFYFPYWTAIDNFTPFGITGAVALLLAWKGMRELESLRSGAWADEKKRGILCLVLAGLFAGLAHLSRADGALVLVAVFLFSLLRGYKTVQSTRSVISVSLFVVVGYFLVMAPWFVRNWQLSGAILPGAGSQTIWLVGYDDLFSYGRQLTAQTFFAAGLKTILWGRWWVFTTNLQTVLAVWGMIFLTPLAVIGGWHLRKHTLIQLAALYGVLLFVSMTLIFAFPGARGGLFHSGAALLPVIYGAAVVGLDRIIEWIATHRRGWNVRTAKQFFGVGMMVLAIALSGFIFYRRVVKNNIWNGADAAYSKIATWVTRQNPNAVVMIGNPPAYRYHGGGLSVVVPNENLKTMLRAANQFGVTYLVLDRNHPASLANVHQNPTDFPDLILVNTIGNDIFIFKIDTRRQKSHSEGE